MGGIWLNRDFTFDNIGEAMVTLFVMATTACWSETMNYALASNDIDLVPLPITLNFFNVFWTIFFIGYIIAGAFFFLNLFVGVVISTFTSE